VEYQPSSSTVAATAAAASAVVDECGAACWFHGTIRGDDAQAKVMGGAPGAFLVRESVASDCFVLTIRAPTSCMQYVAAARNRTW
jgi:hypothetical protein